jgi:hypothetical protein
MASDPFKGMRVVGDSAHPKAISPQEITKTYNPRPANPGATVQPKAPLAPAETGQSTPPPPAKHD